MGKRIISFSLYGYDPVYQIGALANLELQKSVYPGWVCRFYVSDEIPDSVVRQLKAGDAEVIVRKRTCGASGTFWRFLPASESDLDALIVRDVDSRLNYRERAAVDEWLVSGRGFHIMRDHPEHRALILAGMWGCRGGVLPQMACLIARWPTRDDFGRDQKFLAVKIYPRIMGDCMIHSDLVRYENENVRPFPADRERSDFVGRSLRGVDDCGRRLADLTRVIVLPMPSHLGSSRGLAARVRMRIRRQIEDAYCRLGPCISSRL